MLEEWKIIADYQFGFRKRHSTVEQVHRTVPEISQDLEKKKHCSAVFLNIQQAFDKVWHIGLKYKLKNILLHPYYSILQSYLTNRTFRVRYLDANFLTFSIDSGVLQGSVFGPLLQPIYLLYLLYRR